MLQISGRDARDGETNINFTDYPKLLLESWHFEIQMKTRNAYIQKWGIESYNKIILRKFNKVILSRVNHHSQIRLKVPDPNSDSGYYAYPARVKEKLAGISDISSSIWWLIRNNVPGLIPMVYPTFFWRTRYFSILFVLPWSTQKYGIK